MNFTLLKTVILHLGVWTSFIAYEVYVAHVMGSKATPFDFACFYLLNIGLFYFHAHLGGSFAARKRHAIAAFVVVLLAELILYDLVSIGMDVFVSSVEQQRFAVEIYWFDFVRGLWRGFYFLGLSTGYYFAMRTIRELRSKLAAERREAALEQAHLRAQINPHLLFNVINFIYNMVEGVSQKAAECLLLLAKSMRYAMMPAYEDGLVELYREVEQIDRLISINQLVTNNKTFLSKQIGEECYGSTARIPPLLLLTFIENIFKHGNLIDKPGMVQLHIQDQVLHFHTENLQANRRHFIGENIGLKNAQARLEKYYRDNFVLESSRNGSIFIVDLKLKL